MVSIVRKSIELARDLWQWLRHGCKTVRRSTRARRLAHCYEPCPCLDDAGRRCRRCGCYIKLMTYLATKRCPEDRWR